MRQARFEIMKLDKSEYDYRYSTYRHYWARFVAANNRIVWTTETYPRKADAERACRLLNTDFVILDKTGEKK